MFNARCPVRRGPALLPALLACLTPAAAALAQQAPVNGMRPADLRAHAIVGATVVTAPGHVIENATIVMRDGLIVAVAANLEAPSGAWIWSGKGLTAYPGFIEPALLVDVAEAPPSPGAHWNGRVHPEVSVAARSTPAPEMREELRKLGFAVAAVYPRSGIFRGSGAVVALADSDEHALAYRERAAMAMGFEQGGRGGGAGGPSSLMGSIALIRQTLHDAHWHALCRKVYEHAPDANEPPIRADALVALDDVINRRQSVLFQVADEHNALRAARIAREFELDLILLGSGMEFRRLPEIAALHVPLIVPLQFPERPDPGTLADAERLTLQEMMTWEQAPTNPRRLVEAGVAVALTTQGLENRSDFQRRLRDAVGQGLSESDALAALTTVPARLLGLEGVLGTIAPGHAANVVLVDGSIFDKKPTIREVWINGRRHEIEPAPLVSLVAKGEFTTDLGVSRPVEIDTIEKSLSLQAGEQSIRARKLIVQQDQISFVLDGRALDVEGYVRLSGVMGPDGVTGTGVLPDGRSFAFSIVPKAGEAVAAGAGAEAGAKPPDAPGDGVSGEWTLSVDSPRGAWNMTLDLTLDAGGGVSGKMTSRGRDNDLEEGRYDAPTGALTFAFEGRSGRRNTIEATIRGETLSGTLRNEAFTADVEGTRGPGTDEVVERAPQDLVYPLGEFGLAAPPQPQSVLVENATIWTCGPQGIIEEGDLYVEGGKIRSVGRDLLASLPESARGGLLVIDGRGRHVTPGLIDCHSHTGIDGGVNEGAQTNTAEVRIGDVIDPDDVNWYRQLAGGLTAANQLHGSANPIGGQNSVVKIKWGSPAEAFPVPGAIGGIKFALGENVKRSRERYPNTRMGVETFIRDAFTAAGQYRDAWTRYLALPTEERRRTYPPRKDLELDALVEILEGQRLVHCHSYRQDEILMLIRVAEDFSFTIGTFQHVLEGYKVADAIAAHGAGGSSFSDWWAYKMEVMDAVPHNGALMTDVGVLMSFNSDSSELARRMNTEAAKAVRYGGLEPHEALKLVTLNPARQLRIDGRTGSLEAGKDGDFVIWSAAPLSTYARCEETWVEGARCFSLEQDLALRATVGTERRRLLQKILSDAHGPPTRVAQQEQEQPAPAPSTGAATARAPSRLLERLARAQRDWMLEQVRLGADPLEIRPGRCACNEEWWMDLMESALGLEEEGGR